MILPRGDSVIGIAKLAEHVGDSVDTFLQLATNMGLSVARRRRFAHRARRLFLFRLVVVDMGFSVIGFKLAVQMGVSVGACASPLCMRDS
eukprot:15458647-Alexandrium_andersonii.AAC.1